MAAVAVSAVLFAVPTVANADTTVVHPNGSNGWVVVNQDLDAGNPAPSGSFVNGPASPPSGLGSFRQQANTGDKQLVQTGNFAGAPLTGLALSYWTYTTDTAPTILTAALNILVDTDGDGFSNRTLVYEPYEQPAFIPGHPATASATWQKWEIDGDSGVWWATGMGYGVGGPRKTLDQWRTEFAAPNATIATFATDGNAETFRIVAGSTGTSWPTIDGNVDEVTVNGDTYDFETFTQTIDCSAVSDDIAAVQAAVNGIPNGSTIKLGGTCDFTAAASHDGDITSIVNTAVLIRPGTPIDGLTIQSDGDPQSATILGSGRQAAFTIAPGNDNVTIKGLRFVNVGRAVVSINNDGTTVGAAGGLPSEEANRIVGSATTDSAILGLAIARNPAAKPDGTVELKYGPASALQTAVYTGQNPATLTDLEVRGNYISYNPPGSGATADVVAIDVRQRFCGVVDGVNIIHNAVGMFSSEFPSINHNGVKVHALTPGDSCATPGSQNYWIRNVDIIGNNLGRLEEIAEIADDAADVHAAGRLGIHLIGVDDFDIVGNGVRTRLSTTGVPMPGGGVAVSDSMDGRITDNGIIVVPSAGTVASDLGAIGVVDDMSVLFGDPGKPQTTHDVVVRDNVIGVVGQPEAPLGGQRGIVVNGAKDIAVDNNDIQFTTDDALNIGVQVQGPGSPTNPGPFELPREVDTSTLCNNNLDGTSDDVDEVTFGGGAASAGNYFPGGGAFAGNANCGAPPALLSTVPADGASKKSADVPQASATYDRDLQAPPTSTFVLKDKTGTPVAGSTALCGPTSVTGGKRSICFTPAEALSQLASPYSARVDASTAGAGTTTTTWSFVIDDTAPAAPTIAAPANGSTVYDQPVHVMGNAEPNSTVKIFEGATQIGSGIAAANGSYDITLPYPAEEASHTIHATATDAAGNVSGASVAVSFTHDSIAPAAPSITTPADGSISGLAAVTVSGTAPEGGTILLFDGATQITTTTASGSPATWSTIHTFGEGAHTLTAKLRDAAGNVSPASTAVNFTVDTTAPGAPSVQVSPTPINAANDDNLTVSGTAEPGSTIDVEIDDANPGTAAVTGGTTAHATTGAYSVGGLDVSGLDDGALTVKVTSTDAGNNSMTTTVIMTKDATPPAAPTVTIAPDPVNAANENSVTVSGTAEPGTTADIVVTSSVGTETLTADDVPVDGAGLYAATFDAGTLEDGTLTAEVRITDGFDNTGPAATDTAIKDTQAPGAPTITSPAANAVVTSTTFAVTGGAEAGATVEIFEGATLLATTVADGAGAWSTPVTIDAGDGARTIRARQRDAAGNQGTTFADRTIVLNTEVPSVESTSPADDATVMPTATVSATYSESLQSGTMQVRNNANTLVNGTVAIDDDTVRFTTQGNTPLPEAGSPYTVQTTGTDLAGTSSVLHTFSFSTDSGPPETTITGGPDGNTTNGSVSFTFTSSEPGSTFTCQLDAQAPASCSSPKAYTGLSDGPHTFSVFATDPAGNEDTTPASRAWTVDVTAPDTEITAGPSGTVTSDDATFEFISTEPGSTFTCKLDGGAEEACTSGTTYNGLSDGSHTFRVYATDAIGNADATPASRTWTVDTTAPGAPVISSPAQNAVLNSRSVTIEGTAEPNSTVHVREGATEIGFDQADGSGDWSLTVTFATDGTKTITATAEDENGNEGPASAARTFSIDSAAPLAPVINTPAEGVTLNSTSVTISGTAEANSTVTVREGATVIGTAPVNGAGAWSLNATMGQGAHTVSATAADAAGNVSPAATRSFSIDSVAPAKPTITQPTEGQTLSSNLVIVQGNAEANSTVKVYEGASLIATTTADLAGNWTTSASFSTGDHIITATATDGAGNTSDPSGPRKFKVDANRPTVTITTDDGKAFLLEDVVIDGTASDNRGVRSVVVEYFNAIGTKVLTQNATVTPPDGAEVTWQAKPTGLLPGRYTARATAIDVNGLVSTTASRTFVKAP